MHFQLPTQLKLEVVKYDSTLKALAKQQEQEAKARKKATHPRGNVISLGLIPEDIVKLADQQEAIDHINAAPAEDAVFLFNRLKELGKTEPCAVLYYHKQMWISFWLPRDSKDYWYGMSIAYKNNKTACKAIDIDRIWCTGNSPYMPLYEMEEFNQTKIGRTDWLYKTVFFTQDVINEGYTREYWRYPTESHALKSYGKNHAIGRAVNQVADVLQKRVPSWSNDRTYSHGIWARTTPQGNSIAHCLDSQRRGYLSAEGLANYKNTPDYWMTIFHGVTWIKDRPAMQALVKTSWFRKKLSWMCNAMQLAFDNAANRASVYDITAPLGEVDSFLNSCYEITKLYPDINVDFLISRYDVILESTFSCRSGPHEGMAWVQKHLSPESFFNMLGKFHALSTEEHNENQRMYHYRIEERMNRPRFFWRHFEDTINMVNQIVVYNNTLPKDAPKLDPMPRRWRMNEWHDHVMGETWKIKNPKVDLPQKLFPEPIKVDNFTFIQPIDTHQLSKWGQAVRNCVGSGNYAEGIKKFKHLIVLAMIDGKPRYTIQLNVDNGVMNVAQMTDLSNSRLSDEQRGQLEDKFKLALQEREKQLT
jgi:hypothetical protein